MHAGLFLRSVASPFHSFVSPHRCRSRCCRFVHKCNVGANAEEFRRCASRTMHVRETAFCCEQPASQPFSDSDFRASGSDFRARAFGALAVPKVKHTNCLPSVEYNGPIAAIYNVESTGTPASPTVLHILIALEPTVAENRS